MRLGKRYVVICNGLNMEPRWNARVFVCTKDADDLICPFPLCLWPPTISIDETFAVDGNIQLCGGHQSNPCMDPAVQFSSPEFSWSPWLSWPNSIIIWKTFLSNKTKQLINMITRLILHFQQYCRICYLFTKMIKDSNLNQDGFKNS